MITLRRGMYVQHPNGAIGRVEKVRKSGAMKVAWLNTLRESNYDYLWHPDAEGLTEITPQSDIENYMRLAGTMDMTNPVEDLCMNLAVLVGMIVIIWLIRTA